MKTVFQCDRCNKIIKNPKPFAVVEIHWSFSNYSAMFYCSKCFKKVSREIWKKEKMDGGEDNGN